MKSVVLVTAIGTMASTAIVTRLKGIGEYYLIGTDIFREDQVATSKDVDDFYVIPSAVDDLDGYISYMVEFCKKHAVEFYFATIDEEIANLSKHRKAFEQIGVKLCIPNHKLVITCHYKNTFTQWVAQNLPEIAIKTFEDPTEILPQDYPLFVKPTEGRASIGCRRIDNREQLGKFLQADKPKEPFIIQQFTDGEVVTVDLIRSAKTGQSMQIQRRETLRNTNGCGIAVEIINDAKLTKICNELMEHLELNGVVNAEFFHKGDTFKIIEVNPRFSAGTTFSCLAGCDTVANEIRIARDERLEFGEIAYGRCFAKRYETYRMC